MLLVRTRNTEGGAFVESELLAPSLRHYPLASEMLTEERMQNGALVSAPIVDPRPRKLVWENFPVGHSEYEATWTVLQALHYESRAFSGMYPYIEIWDSGPNGRFDRMSGGTKVFTKVRVGQVERKKTASVYGLTTVVFVIEDAGWLNFPRFGGHLVKPESRFGLEVFNDPKAEEVFT